MHLPYTQALLLNVIMEMLNEKRNKDILADKALYVEQNILKEAVGSQDQIITSFGGLNHIKFCKDGTYEINSLKLDFEQKNKLLDHLMLFYTGTQRYAVNIESDKIKNIKKNSEYLKNISKIKDEALNLFSKKELNFFEIGNLLNKGWQMKKKLSSKVSNDQIDKWYEKAINAGAIGGKLSGAGSGGFLSFIVPENKKDEVRSALSELEELSIQIEPRGSCIIYSNY